MTSTNQMLLIVGTMLAINIALTMVQGAILDVNPDGEQFFDTSASPYANYIQNGTLIVDDSYLPSDDTVEGDTSGNIFTDTYKSIKSWVQQKLAPLNFVSNVLKQPYGFLVDIGLPESISVGFGLLWYMFALIVLVSWWMGR